MAKRLQFVVRTKKPGRSKNWYPQREKFDSVDDAIDRARDLQMDPKYSHVKVSLPSGLGYVDLWKDGVEFKEFKFNATGANRIIIEEDS